jgi:hypothetical protein
MSSSSGEPRRPGLARDAVLSGLLDATLGLTAVVVHESARAAHLAHPVTRPVLRLLLHPPLIPDRWHLPAVASTLRRTGSRTREDLAVAGGRLLDRAVPRVLDEVLRRVDVTEVVVTRVDLDAVAARLDVERLLGRVDLPAIATQVIDAVDLPEIIRGSSGAMASDTIVGARLRGIAGDQAISRVRDRLLPGRGRNNVPITVSDTTAPAPDAGGPAVSATPEPS